MTTINKRGDVMLPCEHLNKESICVGLNLTQKEQVVDILAALLQKGGSTNNYKGLRQQLLEQEEQAFSAIGAGVAITQVQSPLIQRMGLAAVTLKTGADYRSPDGMAVRLAMLVALPEQTQSHLASRLSVMLLNEDLREQLIGAADEETFIKLLRLSRVGLYSKGELPLILAVLDAKNEDAPRAEAVLQQTAAKRGVLLKTALYKKEDPSKQFLPEDLADAAGVLLMGSIPAEPFDGKPLLRAGITDGIYRPEHLLNCVPEAPVFRVGLRKRKGKLFVAVKRIFGKK